MKLLRQFRLLVILSCVLAALTAGLLIMNTITDKLNYESRKTKTEASEYRVSETKQKLNNLEKVLRNSGIPDMTRINARKTVLSMAEKISKVYNSRLLSDITDDGAAYCIQAEITVTPFRSQDFTDLIRFFDLSVSPVIKVKNADFHETNKIKTVKLTIMIIQPYKGGKYVF